MAAQRRGGEQVVELINIVLRMHFCALQGAAGSFYVEKFAGMYCNNISGQECLCVCVCVKSETISRV